MQHVQLDVAADPTHLSLPRLLIGYVAASLDMTVDHVEDLQLALDELCVLVMADAATARTRLTVRVEWDERELRVEIGSHGESVGPLHSGAELTAFSQQILDALVDEHGVSVRDGDSFRWLRLTKRTNSGAA